MSRHTKPKAQITDGLSIDIPDLDSLIDADAEFDAVNIGVRFGGDLARAHRESPKKIVTFDARKVQCAADTIHAMPAPDESIHIIVGQMFAGFDLIPAFLKLTGAKAFQSLYLTTLGFSRDNLAQLEAMFRAGQINPKTLKILCGDFFRRADSGLWDIGKLLAREHGFTFKSYRSHTKLILAKIMGKFYVVESSANLRSCHNIEFFTVTQSPTLFRFHAGWIEECLSFAKA